MRKKVLKLIITFTDIQQALDCEKKCQEAGIGERLIPVPGQISAGCGLAWKAELVQKIELQSFFEEHHIEYEGFYEGYLLERCTDKDV